MATNQADLIGAVAATAKLSLAQAEAVVALLRAGDLAVLAGHS